MLDLVMLMLLGKALDYFGTFWQWALLYAFLALLTSKLTLWLFLLRFGIAALYFYGLQRLQHRVVPWFLFYLLYPALFFVWAFLFLTS